MSINLPIDNAAFRYVSGLSITKTGNKEITLSSGSARNSTNVNDIILSSNTIINGNDLGANGVDSAVLATSSFYNVYVVGDSTKNRPTAGLLSLESSVPVLPFGYDMYRRVGAVLTDGSANILDFHQYGVAEERTYYYDVGISKLAGGSDTAFTAVDLLNCVPATAGSVILDVAFTPDVATDLAEFLPFGSTASDGIVRFGYGVAAAQVGMATVPVALDVSSPKILYKVTAGDTLTLLVKGYKDHLG